MPSIPRSPLPPYFPASLAIQRYSACTPMPARIINRYRLSNRNSLIKITVIHSELFHIIQSSAERKFLAGFRSLSFSLAGLVYVGHSLTGKTLRILPVTVCVCL